MKLCESIFKLLNIIYSQTPFNAVLCCSAQSCKMSWIWEYLQSGGKIGRIHNLSKSSLFWEDLHCITYVWFKYINWPYSIELSSFVFQNNTFCSYCLVQVQKLLRFTRFSYVKKWFESFAASKNWHFATLVLRCCISGPPEEGISVSWINIEFWARDPVIHICNTP